VENLSIEPLGQDILDSPQAGARVIRGTVARTGAYVAGLALGLVAVPLLTRHLGVADYGSYVVVGSLLGIAMIFADSGLSTVALRELGVRDADSRIRLLRNLVSARMILAALSATGAVVFAVVAGYEPVLVAGAVVGGLGLVISMAQLTYALPLVSGLQLERSALLDLLRQVVTVVGILALVALGAGLFAFFVLSIPVAVIVLCATLVSLPRRERVWPSIDREEWRYLIGEAVPAATATVLASFFYRVAIVVMSLLATAEETGYFGLSYRVSEVFIAVPWLVVGSAFAVLARAADTDITRFAAAYRQLFDASVILGAGSAFVLVAGAQPIIDLLGGSEFDPAVPVLRIQGLAVGFTFLVTLFGAVLWIVRAKRQLVITNLFGLCLAIGLTVALVPAHQAQGAALAMLTAESVLAVGLGTVLLRGRPSLRPSLRTLAKVLVALAAATGVALLPIPALVGVIVGGAAYCAILLALRAIPLEVLRHAFGGWRSDDTR
jgi:O-antigen/teichoic acid export membrane protein